MWRPADRKDRAQYHLDSHADFPSLPPKLESEWRDYWTFFLVLLEIAPVISTIGDEDIFALAEKCFSLRLPRSIGLIYVQENTTLRSRARSPAVFFCLSSRRARAPRIPSESVAFESPRRTDGRSALRLALGDFDDEEEESVLSRFSHEKPIVSLSHSLHPPVAWNEGGLTD